MKKAFNKALVELARKKKDIFLVLADIGFAAVEPFAEEFPDRFVNVGVCEQNMTGVATGLSMSGKIPFTYTITNFATIRCFEQIRNDICYHKANVKVVGMGGGLPYGALGTTHHATEDIAALRALPNMTVVSPGDPVEMELAVPAIVEKCGPCYLRSGRGGEKIIHEQTPQFEIGKAIEILEGKDLTFVATGAILYNALEGARILQKEGIKARVLSMHTIKPIDRETLQRAARETGTIITVEEHNIIGGLGSAVAEVLLEMDIPVAFKRLGITRYLLLQSGKR